MSKTKARYYYQEAYNQRRINYCTILFFLAKILLFAFVIVFAVIEGSIVKRKLIHSNEKSLNHAGTFISSNEDLIDSNDFVKQSRHKSNFVLYTDVRLFIKEKQTVVSKHCINEKICLRVEGCPEPKCLNVKERLIESDRETLKLSDQDKKNMLRKFMFYVRPKSDYVYSRVVPNNEELLVFYPSQQFNVFSIATILQRFVNMHKMDPSDKLAKQNWQNPQRAQEILGELPVLQSPEKIANQLNQISMR